LYIDLLKRLKKNERLNEFVNERLNFIKNIN
jgi:hypothetical protein